ncbi:NAD-dependent epimerase/dehydratase family protein, partial [Clostridioides difficile]|uniref:GDP-mannose 4,6-dehydratase n=1 Tax=Clostridioides difficile TaxID=1496 RepID=UPI0018DDA135
KGGWTALLLRVLGARVTGFALPPEGEPNLFSGAVVARDLDHRVGDLRDLAAVSSAITEAKPEIVLHMGAQSLVPRSYLDPVSTYATNVMGTV